MTNAVRTPELHTLALFCYQREAMAFHAQLLSEALDHVGRFVYFLTEQNASRIAVEYERRNRLQVNPPQVLARRDERGFVLKRVLVQLKLDGSTVTCIELVVRLFQTVVVGFFFTDRSNRETY